MDYQTKWIIAAAGKHALLVSDAGLTCLHLCACLSAEGKPELLTHPVSTNGDYLGITDGGGIPAHPRYFAEELVRLAAKRNCIGIMADFERPELSEAVTALDEQAQQAGLLFLLPLALADAAPHAILIADTAISGGSLEQYFDELIEKFGRERLAAQLIRCCADFLMPCSEPNGIPLSPEEFSALHQKTGSVVFFSRELCAKYFTYSAEGHAHFVLFDDDDTLRAKEQVLHRLAVPKLLLLYPDAVELGLLKK